MELTQEQLEAVARGEAVPLTVAGQECVLVRRDAYELLQAEYDSSPWTKEEMDLLADEAERITSESEEDELSHERPTR